MTYSRATLPLTIYVNGTASTNLFLRRIRRSLGSSALDYAELVVATGASVADVSLGAGYGTGSQEIEIYVGEQVVHWGKAMLSEINIADDGDALSYTSRVEPFHFGGPLLGMVEWDVDLSEAVDNYGTPIFNPVIDGLRCPNLRLLTDGDASDPYFVDPESVRTTAAQTYQDLGSGASYWTLAQAVLYLCRELNASQEYITNPTESALVSILGSDTSLLGNFELEQGLYLPEALDRLLTPFGFSWFLLLGAGTRTITVIQRGAGSVAIPNFPAPGSVLDTSTDDCYALQVGFDVSRTVNQVHAVGDWKYWEATVVLMPAWDSSLDSTAISLLAKDADTGSDDYNSSAPLQRVWREWVLNEGGDYIGLRGASAPYDMGTNVFLHFVSARRRKFLPTITQTPALEPAGDVHGVFIEFSIDRGLTWAPISTLGYQGPIQLLERECGIRFDGNLPPDRAVFAGADYFQIRVTATFRDDVRLESTTSISTASPLGDTNCAIVYVPDRFHYRQRVLTGTALSQLSTGPISGTYDTSSVVDDSSAIGDFATSLRNSWDMSDVSGRLSIDCIDHLLTYELGEIVPEVNGRNIVLTGQISAGKPAQIAGITLNWTSQNGTLEVENYRNPGPG